MSDERLRGLYRKLRMDSHQTHADSTRTESTLRHLVLGAPAELVAALGQSGVVMLLPGVSIMEGEDGKLLLFSQDGDVFVGAPMAPPNKLTVEQAAKLLTCSPEELEQRWVYWVEVILSKVSDYPEPQSPMA